MLCTRQACYVHCHAHDATCSFNVIYCASTNDGDKFYHKKFVRVVDENLIIGTLSL